MLPFLRRGLKIRSLYLIVLCFITIQVSAQTGSCPINIDFELGSFQNWQCYTGSTYSSGTTNYINVNPSAPISGIHEIIPKGPRVDPYGGFSLNAPDGSNYSVKLGNNGTGSQAERLTYTFTVPQTQADFVITYQYAVVLQDPGHAAYDQPRFTAKVFDVTSNAYVGCGSFDYVATSALPGFKRSASYSSNQVIYKDWTPASINLYGLQGHQLRLEFTTADCTQGGHFGYAYIDVNNSCSSLIKGTDFCPSATNTILTGPAGFNLYNWYSADRSKLLGTGATLSLPTAGLNGTTIQLDLIPFVGFGCNYTTSAVLHALPTITFKTTDPLQVCFPATVNITTANITAGSDSNLTFTYWTDAAATIALTTPNAVAASATYYIKATAPSGCFDIQPVKVVVNALPVLTITDPPTACLTSPVDITFAAVTAGSSAGLTYSYWLDAAATQPLATPSAINTIGTYYIKGTNASGCFLIKPVHVTFYPLPVLVISNPPAVCFPGTIDITQPYITLGSDPGLSFSYWADAAATVPLPTPAAIPKSGIYYIKATNLHSCEKILPVTVTVNLLPNLLITTPVQVCTPSKIDITAADVTNGSDNIATLSYWMDIKATIPLKTPTAIADSGTYYIKAISPLGCEIIKPVLVTIHQTPVVVVTNPAKVYVPNTVDITRPELVNGSTPNLKYTYWNDAAATDPIANPKSIILTGTYYIKGNNTYCYDIEPVNVNVSLVPEILVPKAFTPTQATNNTLYPFLVGVKTLVAFKIYNRWGDLVFQTDSADPKNGWNGVYKGKIQFLDTFTWYAEGYDYTDKVVHKTGNTVLLK